MRTELQEARTLYTSLCTSIEAEKKKAIEDYKAFEEYQTAFGRRIWEGNLLGKEEDLNYMQYYQQEEEYKGLCPLAIISFFTKGKS